MANNLWNFQRDVLTCWNSSLNLLSQSEGYKGLLYSFMQYIASNDILYLHHQDIYTKICQLLKAFTNATTVLSNVYYPTTYIFIIESVPTKSSRICLIIDDAYYAQGVKEPHKVGNELLHKIPHNVSNLIKYFRELEENTREVYDKMTAKLKIKECGGFPCYLDHTSFCHTAERYEHPSFQFGEEVGSWIAVVTPLPRGPRDSATAATILRRDTLPLNPQGAARLNNNLETTIFNATRKYGIQ